jgi:hypothetical protein
MEVGGRFPHRRLLKGGGQPRVDPITDYLPLELRHCAKDVQLQLRREGAPFTKYLFPKALAPNASS